MHWRSSPRPEFAAALLRIFRTCGADGGDP
jgi:hypothetical protein